MKSKTFLIIISILLAVIVLTGIFSAGFFTGSFLSTLDRNPIVQSVAPLQSLFSTSVTPGQTLPDEKNDSPVTTPEILKQVAGVGDQEATPQDLEELFIPFWQTWDLVKNEYVDQPVDEVNMMRGAIRGMLESLGDQHTSYLDPEMFEQANAQLKGEEYEGIGAWVDITGEYLTIIAPMPGSPAEKAGLKPNDKVIAIDGEDMTGIDGELVRQKVLGPRGTKVKLTILREGVGEPFDVEIERASIIVPSVESRMLEDNIAYIRLYTFGDDTTKDLKEAINKLMAEQPKGLILDLRNNGGGYLDTAIDVVSQFVKDGVVMYEEYGDGSRETFEAKKGGLATDIPLAVLINGGSASASEIVAGAIQDRGRGKLVGETSFGKGSVQSYVELENKQGAVRVTIARWLTPNGKQIMSVGLQPDFVVEITDADIQANLDPQLERAIQWLLEGK